MTESFPLKSLLLLPRTILVPSEIAVRTDKDKVLALLSSYVTAPITLIFTLFLHRIMNIPAVVNLRIFDFTKIDGREAIVDGYDGKLIINLIKKTTAYYIKTDAGKRQTALC